MNQKRFEASPELLAKIECALLRRRHCDYAEVGNSVASGVFPLLVISQERPHLAREIGLLLPVVALAGTDNFKKEIGRVLSFCKSEG